MAAVTPTGPGETRALSAALTAPTPFAGRAASLALHASDRHVDRWAPEQGAVRRSRSLGTLSFVDRLLQPWMRATTPAAQPILGGAAGERAQAVSWVFPRPWYQDELDWMAAAREAGEGPGRGSLTTRGTFAGTSTRSPDGSRAGSPTGIGVALPAGGDARQAVVVVADTIRKGPIPAASLAYVAPSMGGSPTAAPTHATGAPTSRALRAWSPQVSFAAAQAAEVMAATVAAIEHAGEHAGLSAAQRSPLLEGLAFVAPSEISGEPEAAPSRGVAPAPARAPEAPAAAQLARAVAQLAAAQAVSRAPASTPEAARAAVSETAPIARGTGAAASPAAVAYHAEQARVLEQLEPAAAATPASASFAELVQTAGASPAAAHAMRAVELFARSALAGTIAPVGGPRVAMPTGLGGALVGAAAAAATRRPLVGYAEPVPAAFATEPGRPAPALTRSFAPVWAAAPTATPALAAVAGDRPAAMSHLAWADRWLARIAGASPASLTALDVAAEHRGPAPRTLTLGAPEVVYVLPELELGRSPEGSKVTPRPGAPTLRAVPEPARAPSPSQAPRIADDEATPDEVFAAIARAARPGVRREPAAPPPIAPSLREVPAEVAPPRAPAAAKPTLADAIAHAAPAAPAAGLHAGLASSPMAPALAGILPLQAAPVFDPRALFADGLTRAYLAGVMVRGDLVPPRLPPLAGWALPGGAPDAGAEPADPLGVAARAPDVTYLELARAADGAAPDAGGAPVARAAALAPMQSVRSSVLASPFIARYLTAEAAELAASPGAELAAPTPTQAPAIESPLTQVDAAAWSPRPGMTAELAQGFAVDRERTAGDLSFDFVAPEQVLAARVFGFGAVEAAQAARLAVAGPSGLSAMAAALDLTFLRQLHVASEEAAPALGAEVGLRAAAGAPRLGAVAASPVAASSPAMTPIAAWPAAPAAATSGTMFGVERRLPRGAFLWPAGVVAALDLGASLPEGAAASQVAALELLAAGAVAHMGALAAPFGLAPADEDAAGPARRAAGPGSAPAMTSLVLPDAAAEPAAGEAAAIAAAAEVPAPERARFESIYLSLSRSAAGQSLSPSVRAARALAIAAAQDGAAGVEGSARERARAAWSVMPAVYAGGAAPGHAFEPPTAAGRAPAPELTVVGSPYGDAPAFPDDEMRPGLSRLAARAGEAIGSFVRPSAPEVSQASSGAAHVAGGPAERGVAEPFVHELIRTGRAFSRVGGGEAEIPSWFEAAAKKMLEQRGLGESLSVAELTLIASTPARQVAASARDAGGGPAPAAAQAPAGESSAQGDKPDVEKIAADVYAEILKLIDVARERSGDPWL